MKFSVLAAILFSAASVSASECWCYNYQHLSKPPYHATPSNDHATTQACSHWRRGTHDRGSYNTCDLGRTVGTGQWKETCKRYGAYGGNCH
ncbi:uncharacterized protein LY79DRAFT_564738 [Colletotrichum navitas]|uniref:Uncharacterized protein n=1 Tax=Colletotrichum navitas TaxID=681940 RepID=A0AAD8V201_9PEZI|nr:uncharacterized protein LY79DRAFT_564738 [Colletotrichum navitas]KAK1579233.1 hypothetical protein LY79DRAFT_564738 [Colletotrichum navitas]